MSETEKNERIAELETTSAKLLAEVRRLEKAGTELERIAAHRLDELVDLRARVLEMEGQTVVANTWGLKPLEALGEFLRVATMAQGPVTTSIAVRFQDAPDLPVLHLWATNDEQEPAGHCRLLAAERDEALARVAARENELSAATAAIEGNLRRITKLEPLAEVGRRMMALCDSYGITRAMDGGHRLGTEALAEALLFAFRAAEIGEEAKTP